MNDLSRKTLHMLNSLLIKAGIVVMYTLVIAIFLYLPRFTDLIWKQSKTLNVYSFTEMISAEALQEFEEQTGISVSITYFETNEDLYTKFKVTGGEGYDLITPSDYMVELLVQENLLHTLDHTKISNIQELDSRLLNRFYDPKNRYSLPVAWNVYGVAFDRDVIDVKNDELSLDVIFKGPSVWKNSGKIGFDSKICMLDDPFEAVMLAAIYLFGRVDNLSTEDYKLIKQLLVEQKKWVECYTNSSLFYYLQGNIVPVALTSGLFMRKMAEETDRFSFMIPKEGSLLGVETLAIPARSKKVVLAHKLMNFLLSRKISHFHTVEYGSNPGNRMVYPMLDKSIIGNPHYFPPDEWFDKLHQIHNNFPMHIIEKIWLAVKFG
jgi:spermidine/putrescine transport system substrate-binding protein